MPGGWKFPFRAPCQTSGCAGANIWGGGAHSHDRPDEHNIPTFDNVTGVESLGSAANCGSSTCTGGDYTGEGTRDGSGNLKCGPFTPYGPFDNSYSPTGHTISFGKCKKTGFKNAQGAVRFYGRPSLSSPPDPHTKYCSATFEFQWKGGEDAVDTFADVSSGFTVTCSFKVTVNRSTGLWTINNYEYEFTSYSTRDDPDNPPPPPVIDGNLSGGGYSNAQGDAVAQSIFSALLAGTAPSYWNSSSSVTSDGYKVSVDNSATVTLGDAYTMDEAITAEKGLRAMIDLTDDAKYPWRTDTNVGIAPLVTNNQRRWDGDPGSVVLGVWMANFDYLMTNAQGVPGGYNVDGGGGTSRILVDTGEGAFPVGEAFGADGTGLALRGVTDASVKYGHLADGVTISTTPNSVILSPGTSAKHIASWTIPDNCGTGYKGGDIVFYEGSGNAGRSAWNVETVDGSGAILTFEAGDENPVQGAFPSPPPATIALSGGSGSGATLTDVTCDDNGIGGPLYAVIEVTHAVTYDGSILGLMNPAGYGYDSSGVFQGHFDFRALSWRHCDDFSPTYPHYGVQGYGVSTPNFLPANTTQWTNLLDSETGFFTPFGNKPFPKGNWSFYALDGTNMVRGQSWAEIKCDWDSYNFNPAGDVADGAWNDDHRKGDFVFQSFTPQPASMAAVDIVGVQYCIPFSPCCPAVMCISASGTEVFGNGKVFEEPALVADIMQGGWQQSDVKQMMCGNWVEIGDPLAWPVLNDTPVEALADSLCALYPIRRISCPSGAMITPIAEGCESPVKFALDYNLPKDFPVLPTNAADTSIEHPSGWPWQRCLTEIDSL